MIRSQSMELKAQLADEIIDLCRAYGPAEVIRETNTGRVLDIRPKIIAPVSPENADELEQKIHDTIDAVNQQLQDACEIIGRASNFRKHDYKINRISSDEVTLSIGKAKTSKIMTGEHIADWCNELLEKTKEKWIARLITSAKNNHEDAVKLADVIAMGNGTPELWSRAGISEIMSAIHRGKIKMNQQYLISTDSGNSYRVTYYDATKERRIQINLRHILIVETYDPQRFKVTCAGQRKNRSDSRKNEIARTGSFSVNAYLPTKTGRKLSS